MKKDHQIIHYQSDDGTAAIEVNLLAETVWLSLNQLVLLFERDKSVISRHVRNVFKEGELARDSVVAKFATTAADGKTYQVEYYNLDVIISVGYRVKSKKGTNFRIWATQVLRNHLIENAKRAAFGKSYQEKYLQLVKTIDIAASTASTKPLSASEAKGILKVLQDYAYALEMLDRYDHQTLNIADGLKKPIEKLTYKEGIELISEWRKIQSAGQLFGNEKDGSFQSSLETIYQTFDGEDLYPSIEEKEIVLDAFIEFSTTKDFFIHAEGNVLYT